MNWLLGSALVLSSPALTLPQDPEPRELDFQDGVIQIARGMAEIEVPPNWGYLDDEDARFVLEDIWGNPPDADVLGMLFPPSAFDEQGDFQQGWGVIVYFMEEGYVDDGDAEDIDFDDLLREMQDETREGSKHRIAAGYEGIELKGWAEAPHYDSEQHRLYWARRLQFSSEEVETLNYDIRILGRRGYLMMSAIADVDQLSEVSEGCKQLLAAAHFREGHRYEDYKKGIDKIATYGIGGLIAGNTLLKVGFFAKFWKLIMVGVLAVVAAFKRMSRGGKPEPQRHSRARREEEDEEYEDEDEDPEA